MSKLKDLTGKTFGRWKVLYMMPREKGKRVKWMCECSCEKHTRREVGTSQLTTGHSQSCGCLSIDRARESNFKDITGNKYGLLTAKKFLGFDYSKGKGRALWHCECECGKTKDVLQDRLVSGSVTTCGDLSHRKKPSNFNDLTGQRFGELLVISQAPTVNNHTYWICLCNCGNLYKAESSKLISGTVGHCANTIHLLTNIVGNKYGNLTVKEFSHRENNRTFWRCVCDCDGREVIVDGNALKSGATTSCGHKHKTACIGSTDELEIKDELLKILPNNIAQKVRILDGKEIDLYFQDLKFGVEFNGSAFHSAVNGAFRNVDKKLHQQKFLQAKEHGIHLVTIFDVDWWKNKEKILNYFRHCLLPALNKVYARKCDIKEISKELARDFCNKYHLQGYSIHTKYAIGLYYAEELVSVMCFGNLRLKKHEDGQYELHRYCVKDDWQIVGGASKLHKYFERNYNPSYIRSYSDNDYFTGNIYEKLGYDCSGQSNPRYYWFYKNQEYKREQCQLKYLKKEYPDLYEEACNNEAKNKEDYIMVKLHARKVYRCGNTLWEKRFN